MSWYDKMFEVEHPCEQCRYGKGRVCTRFRTCEPWREWFSGHWRRIQLSVVDAERRKRKRKEWQKKGL